jgi:hypothetical protein
VTDESEGGAARVGRGSWGSRESERLGDHDESISNVKCIFLRDWLDVDAMEPVFDDGFLAEMELDSWACGEGVCDKDNRGLLRGFTYGKPVSDSPSDPCFGESCGLSGLACDSPLFPGERELSR